MDVIVCTHVIPSISTLTKVKEKNQVWLELDMYFEKLVHIGTSTYLHMSANTMHQYVVGPTTLKTMMHILSGELNIGVKSVYRDVT